MRASERTALLAVPPSAASGKYASSNSSFSSPAHFLTPPLPVPSPSRSPADSPDDDVGGEGSLFSAGSVLSSVINLCTATLGAGCLALPWAFSQCGLALGLAMLLLAGWASNFTIRLLVRLYATGAHTSFEGLSLKAFGHVGAIITHITVLLFCFGTATASIMVVGDILEPIARLLLPTVHILHHKTMLSILLTCAIMLPLSFYTKISSMRIMSLLSTAGVLILAGVLFIDGIRAGVRGKLKPVELVKVDTTILLALPIIMFAYSCQANIFSILTEARDQRRATDFKVVNIAISVETFLYISIGVAGYSLYGAGIDGNVLRNMDLHNPLHVLAQVCMGLSLCLSYPLCVYPARFTLHTMLFPPKHDQAGGQNHHARSYSNLHARLTGSRVDLTAFGGDDEEEEEEEACSPRSILLTLALVFSSLLVAILIPSISELFTILGSTTATLIAFVLPTGIYLRLGANHAKQRVRRRVAGVMLVVAAILGAVTTARSVQFILQSHSADLRKEPTSSIHHHATGGAHAAGATGAAGGTH